MTCQRTHPPTPPARLAAPGQSPSGRSDYRTLEVLTALTSASVDRVFLAAMTGALGPARIDPAHSGTILLAPTDGELAGAIPEFGIAQAAQGAGWPVEDTVNLQTLRRETGLNVYSILLHAERGAGVALDALGARYVRRSDVPRYASNRFVDDGLRRSDPDGARGYSALDRAYWFGRRDATKRTRLDWAELCILAPVINAREGVEYAWLGPEILDAVAARLLDCAVGAYCTQRGLAPLPAAEFRPLKAAVTRLHERVGLPGINVWANLALVGGLHRVRGPLRIGTRLTPRPFVHVPDDVWDASNRRVAHEWFAQARRAATGTTRT